MSKSDAQRESYLRDGMTLGERVEVLERRLNEIDDAGEDHQYFHDELRSLGRRVGDLERRKGHVGIPFTQEHVGELEELWKRVRELEKAPNPGMTHFVGDDCDGGHRASPTECGRIVVDAGEWDRLQRIKQEAVRVVEMMARAKPTGGVWCGELVSLREAMK